MELKTKSPTAADDLDGYLKLHEIFGLQFFSLKAASKEKFRLRHSVYRTAHFCILITILGVYGGSVVMNTLGATLNKKNVLSSIHQQSFNYFFFATYLASFVQSFLSTKNMRTFFMNSESIAVFCAREFNIKMDFAVVRKAAWRRFCVLMLTFTSILVMVIYIWSDKIQQFFFIVAVLHVLFGFAYLIFIKYTFYVCFVNYQLRFLQKIFLLCFEEKHSKVTSGLNDDRAESAKRMMKKLLVVWKVYNRIKENGSLVNKSSGLTMMLLLVDVVMTATHAGYEICRISIDELPLKHMTRELFSIFYSELP